jgi:FkbM family methyltransferase
METPDGPAAVPGRASDAKYDPQPMPSPPEAILRRLMNRANVEVRRRQNEPFGVRWRNDVAHYLQGRELGIAFDIGGHRGETALKLLDVFPRTDIHTFEPLPENFAVLSENTAGTPIRTVNAAMTDHSGTLTIARGEASYQTGVHASGERIEVRALTVDDYADEHGIDRIGLIKIDTEGHEEAVLEGARRRLEAGAVEFVVCECEFTTRPEETHGAFQALHALLEPLGYRVVSFYTGGVDNLGWLWGDVLYKLSPGTRDEGSVSESPHVPR